jgi:thimet oligopeptidase
MNLTAGQDLLARLEAVQPPFDQATLLEPLNRLLLAIANVESEAYLFSCVQPNSERRRAAEDEVRKAQQLRTRLMQNRRLYWALLAVDETSLDPLTRRALALTRQDMRRAGAELSDAQRKRVAGLRSEIIDLEQAFSRNILEDVRHIELSGPEELEGLPSDYLVGHPPDADGIIRIGTVPPDYEPFVTYGSSDRARFALVQQFYSRGAPANLDVLHRLLSRRHELATMLGCRSWADFITEDKMVGSAANAAAFLREVDRLAHSRVAADCAALLEMKQRDNPDAHTIGLWESAYYQQRINTERLAFDAAGVRPYFEYRAVKQAIFDLTSELFGLQFTRVDEPRIWHPSVETFEVDIDGKPAGRVSLDMHPLAGKDKGASCTPWRVGIGGQQLPHTVLICNFPDPAGRPGPALLDHHEVVVFFHEFGHLVHALARRDVPWVRLAQPSERDFVEAPSQMLEEWIFDYQVLRRFARHAQTGESIPAELVFGLRSAREASRALWAQWLLFRAMLSLQLHDRDPENLDISGLVHQLAHVYLPYQLPPRTHFEASFHHLRNYSAVYYTYLWSQAIAADLLTAFPNGLLDIARARTYRDQVLAPGGTKPAAELLTDFLGRPFKFDAFARWLSGSER